MDFAYDLAAEAGVLLGIAGSGKPTIRIAARQPGRTYFISLFEELGLTPTIVFSSPSIEVVRGMLGQGLGFSLLAPAAWLERPPLTKLALWRRSLFTP